MPFLADVERLSDDYDGDAYVFHSPESCLNLLETLKHRDEITSIEWPEGVRYRIKHYITGDNLHLSLSGRNQWFDLEGELRIGEETIMTISELLQACRHSKGRFISHRGQGVSLAHANPEETFGRTGIHVCRGKQPFPDTTIRLSCF